MKKHLSQLVCSTSHLHARSFPRLENNICQVGSTVNLLHRVSSPTFIFASLPALVPHNALYTEPPLQTCTHKRTHKHVYTHACIIAIPAVAGSYAHTMIIKVSCKIWFKIMHTRNSQISLSMRLPRKLVHAGSKQQRLQSFGQRDLLNTCNPKRDCASEHEHHD